MAKGFFFSLSYYKNKNVRNTRPIFSPPYSYIIATIMIKMTTVIIVLYVHLQINEIPSGILLNLANSV